MRHKKLFVVVIGIALCGVLFWIALSNIFTFLQCQGGYVPAESNDRFMEIVLDAHRNNDYALLNQIATEQAIQNLNYFPKALPLPIQQVYPTDSLKSKYNYRVEMINGEYFDVYLEFEGWLECPVEEFTDEEVIEQYRLMQVGKLVAP